MRCPSTLCQSCVFINYNMKNINQCNVGDLRVRQRTRALQRQTVESKNNFTLTVKNSNIKSLRATIQGENAQLLKLKSKYRKIKREHKLKQETGT